VTNRMVRDIVSLHTNLTTTERAVSVVLGLGLAAVAAQPRPNKLLSLAALITGAALAMRGATGHCSMKAALHHD
jgi:hypothetical protein